MLSEYEKREFNNNVLIPNFMHLVDQDIYSALFDYELKIVVCTTLSAQSIGLETWEQACGLSFRDYANTEVAAKIFSGHYTEQLMDSLHQYAKRIYEI